MPTITRIEKQKKKDDRVNIYLDGKFAFGLDLENFIKFNLRVEQVLTEKEIEKISSAGDLSKLKSKLLNYASLRPRSEKEVWDWFYKKDVSKLNQEKLIKFLKKYDLLDDKKFAAWWVEQRTTFRPKGKKALSQELYQKGIDREIIHEVLENSEIDELKLAKNLYIKNKYKWERVNDEEKRKQKIVGFLGRKGFNWEVIKKVLE